MEPNLVVPLGSGHSPSGMPRCIGNLLKGICLLLYQFLKNIYLENNKNILCMYY